MACAIDRPRHIGMVPRGFNIYDQAAHVAEQLLEVNIMATPQVSSAKQLSLFQLLQLVCFIWLIVPTLVNVL